MNRLLPPPLLLGLLVASVVWLVVLAWRQWPLSLLLQGAVTALLTLAVLLAIGVTWSALWSILPRWGRHG
jgi:hypothetical protein